MQKKIPNLFLVGAPKCGTTALATYLGDHPAIFMSTPKEPHYFATDFPKHRLITDEASYLSLFRNVSNTQNIVGEASVHYLYSREAIRNIHTFNPDAKLIAMLRNPIEMVYSLHSQALHNTDEDEPDFFRAWSLQGDRKAGRNLPRNCRTPEVLMYGEIGRYGEQVERMLSIFPKEQVKLILFDEFKNDARAIYEETLDFLGVMSDGRQQFEVVNANKMRHSYGLAKWASNPPRFVRNTWACLKRWFGLSDNTGQAIGDWIERVNVKVTPRPMPHGVRLMLELAYKDDISKLEALLNRDLSHWLPNVRNSARP
jgi:hypothetical protein